MDHADADPRFPDIDVAHLLIDQLLSDGLLRVALKLGRRNIGPRTHDAGRLRIGRIDADPLLGKDRRAGRKAYSGRNGQKRSVQEYLPFLRLLARHTCQGFPALSPTALPSGKASKRRISQLFASQYHRMAPHRALRPSTIAVNAG